MGSAGRVGAPPAAGGAALPSSSAYGPRGTGSHRSGGGAPSSAWEVAAARAFGTHPGHTQKHTNTTPLRDGPGLDAFLRQAAELSGEGGGGCGAAFTEDVTGSPSAASHLGDDGDVGRPAAYAAGSKVYLETYGCQMNVNDSEIVLSVLRDAGFTRTDTLQEASVILVNTCAIRESAESKIWHRLRYFRSLRQRKRNGAGPALEGAPVVGVLGCMAERLKHKLLEEAQLVDVVAGPDAYRELPTLIRAVAPVGTEDAAAPTREQAINVQLSLEETYADIIPVRDAGGQAAYVSVMRGCNNMCAFCIVPFTRGRERSRPLPSILNEVKALSDQGFREVTLLGQNVNSYADTSQRGRPLAAAGGAAAAAGEAEPFSVYARGFRSVYKPTGREEAVRFAELLDHVAEVDPEMRVRFTSPHPKDFPDELLHVMVAHPNICNQVHMPAQSGSSATLERMRRGYTREAYSALVRHIQDTVPHVSISSDFISGFCGETEEEHAETVSLLEEVGYDIGFFFAYSERGKTKAARSLPDDVPEEVKVRRLQELNTLFRRVLAGKTKAEEGRIHLVLVEGPAKKAGTGLHARTDGGRRVVVRDEPVPATYSADAASMSAAPLVPICAGDYVAVEITPSDSGTLHGRPLGRTSVAAFTAMHGAASVDAPAWLELERAGGAGAHCAAAAGA